LCFEKLILSALTNIVYTPICEIYNKTQLPLLYQKGKFLKYLVDFNLIEMNQKGTEAVI
jgi:hypothetical protein